MGRVDVSFLMSLSKGETPNTGGGGLERTRMGAHLRKYDYDSLLGGVLRYIHVVMISIVSHPFYNIFGWSTNVFCPIVSQARDGSTQQCTRSTRK